MFLVKFRDTQIPFLNSDLDMAEESHDPPPTISPQPYSPISNSSIDTVEIRSTMYFPEETDILYSGPLQQFKLTENQIKDVVFPNQIKRVIKGSSRIPPATYNVKLNSRQFRNSFCKNIEDLHLKFFSLSYEEREEWL